MNITKAQILGEGALFPNTEVSNTVFRDNVLIMKCPILNYFYTAEF